MSSNDRKSFNNAIWLCASCATKIDRDLASHPAELLFSWKNEAEQRARKEQGTRLPEPSDGYDQIAMALTGVGRKFLPQAILNVHEAAASSLNSLDPRFKVQSEFSDGKVHFNIQAREKVSISIKVGPENAGIWTKGFAAMLDRGMPVKLPMQGVSFEGSRLFEVMHEGGEGGTLTLTPNRRAAVVKFFVPQEEITSSEDINGTLAIGRRGVHFEGSGYGGLITLTMDLDRLPGDQIGTNLTISACSDVWEGIDAKTPPYLDKVLHFLECLVNKPGRFLFRLEIEGNHVLTGKNIQCGNTAMFESLLNFSRYVERARALTRYLNINLPISTRESFSAEEHRLLANAVDIVEGRLRYERSQINNEPRLTIVCSDDGRELMAAIKPRGFTSLQQRTEGTLIKVFGQEIQLPPTVLYMAPVRLHVLSKQAVEEGVEFKLRAEMGSDFVSNTVFEPLGPSA